MWWCPQKLSCFKIGGSILQNGENRGNKNGIKPKNKNRETKKLTFKIGDKKFRFFKIGRSKLH
jgi:hypothetical protein